MKHIKYLLAGILAFGMIACSDSDSDGADYRYDFQTGTYTVDNILIDGLAPDAKSTYQFEFSIDRTNNKIVLLEALSLYDARGLVDIEFDHYNSNWNYTYSRWDQPFDICEPGSGTDLVCSEWENGRKITYNIKQSLTTFNPTLGINDAITGVTQSDTTGLFGLIAFDGSTCRVDGEMSTDGTTALLDLDLERGCPTVREIEGTRAVSGLTFDWTIGSDTVKITVDGIDLIFKKFSDTASNRI